MIISVFNRHFAGIFLPIIPIVLAFLMMGQNRALALNISATVDAKNIMLNQSCTLTVTVESSSTNISDIKLPQDLDFYVSPAGTSTSIRLVNMNMSATRVQKFTLIPKKEGQLIIPPISASDGKNKVESEKILIQVASTSQGKTKANGDLDDGFDGAAAFSYDDEHLNNQGSEADKRVGPGNLNDSLREKARQSVFLDAKVEPKNPWNGQEMILIFTLYTTVNIVDYAFITEPAATGFWKEKIPHRRDSWNVNIGGKNFTAAEVGRFALFPTRKGELTIDEGTLRIRIRSRRSSSSPFGSMFDDDFFGLFSTSQADLSSDPIKIFINELPQENKPPSFTGAVGKFDIKVDTDRNQVKQGEALTIKVTVKGKGNIKTISEPILPDFLGFERFNSSSSTDLQPTISGITGEKTFDFVLVPEKSGTLEIDPFIISFFDPESSKYQELRTEKLDIMVEPGKKREATPIIVQGNKEQITMSRDISFILTKDKPLLKKRPLLFHNKLFWLYQTGLILMLGLSWFGAKHQESLRANKTYWRRKKAYSNALKVLAGGKDAIKSQNSVDFYKLMEKALSGYLADLLNQAAPGLVFQDICHLLSKKGASKITLDKLNQLLDRIHAGRFAPGGDSREGQEDILKNATSVIKLLEGDIL